MLFRNSCFPILQYNIFNLVKFTLVVLEKEMLTDYVRWTTNDANYSKRSSLRLRWPKKCILFQNFSFRWYVFNTFLCSIIVKNIIRNLYKSYIQSNELLGGNCFRVLKGFFSHLHISFETAQHALYTRLFAKNSDFFP